MEMLINFIHNWLGSNEFELLTPEKLTELAADIDKFIKSTYPKIPDGKYVTIKFDDHDNPEFDVSKEFVELLEKYYPESLI